jgi:hypothetical protein
MVQAGQRSTFREAHIPSFAAAASAKVAFYFPRAARVLRYFAVPEVAEAAHATQVLDATFVNKGTAGAGATTLCVLTNDSDLAASTTRVSSAWVANDAKELDTQNRPGSPTHVQNTADSIAAGEVIECTAAKAAGTQTGALLVGMEVVESV